MQNLVEKLCRKCGLTLPVANFCINRAAVDGLYNWCRKCKASHSAAHRKANYERYRTVERETQAKIHWADNLLRGSKSGAKTRGLTHALTREDITALYEKQNGKCYWTGVELGDETLPPRHPRKPSLDRIDSAVGYEHGNVVLACTFVNLGRTDNTKETTLEFLAMLIKQGGGHAHIGD